MITHARYRSWAQGVQRLFRGPCARGQEPVGMGVAEIWQFWGLDLSGERKIGGGYCGGGWGKPRSTCQTTNHGSNTKTSHRNQQIAKNLGGYFWGSFVLGPNQTKLG